MDFELLEIIHRCRTEGHPSDVLFPGQNLVRDALWGPWSTRKDQKDVIFLSGLVIFSPFIYTLFLLYLQHLSIEIVFTFFGLGFLSFNSHQLFVHSFERG